LIYRVARPNNDESGGNVTGIIGGQDGPRERLDQLVSLRGERLLDK
jgi:hypothetical protein